MTPSCYEQRMHVNISLEHNECVRQSNNEWGALDPLPVGYLENHRCVNNIISGLCKRICWFFSRTYSPLYIIRLTCWVLNKHGSSLHAKIVSFFNLLALGRCGNNFKSIIFESNIKNSSRGTHYKILRMWMPENLTNEKARLFQVIAWCCQAISHYLNQCWSTFLSPYSVTRPQWVKEDILQLSYISS